MTRSASVRSSKACFRIPKLNTARLAVAFEHALAASSHTLAEALGFADAWEDVELYYTQTMKTDFSDDDEE